MEKATFYDCHVSLWLGQWASNCENKSSIQSGLTLLINCYELPNNVRAEVHSIQHLLRRPQEVKAIGVIRVYIRYHKPNGKLIIHILVLLAANGKVYTEK